MITNENTVKAVLADDHYLTLSGWTASHISRLSQDANGDPVPWYSYAAISFLSSRIKPDMNVFEYGSRHSTLWFGKRAGKVISVENNPAWFSRLLPVIFPNTELVLCSGDDYVYCITGWKNFFQIICIDGEDRNKCAEVCLPSLADNGVIIWDNANKDSNSENRFFPGFRRIDFFGLTPVCVWGNCTTIFYRDNNCLGI